MTKWRNADNYPVSDKDVIAVLDDGTFFMARHNRQLGWGLYFLDNGLQFDSSIGRKVMYWIPLSDLPPLPA